MSDDYAHPVGQASKTLVNGAVELQKQAETARSQGETAKADRLDGEAAQHIAAANDLDRADEAYAERDKG